MKEELVFERKKQQQLQLENESMLKQTKTAAVPSLEQTIGPVSSLAKKMSKSALLVRTMDIIPEVRAQPFL